MPERTASAAMISSLTRRKKPKERKGRNQDPEGNGNVKGLKPNGSQRNTTKHITPKEKQTKAHDSQRHMIPCLLKKQLKGTQSRTPDSLCGSGLQVAFRWY